MRRRDQLVIQLILWLAIGTFLFAVWAIFVGLRKTTPDSSPRTVEGVTNPATSSTN